MRPLGYISAALVSLLLSLDAAAVPMTRQVDLTGDAVGSFTVSFDSTTPAGTCGSACSLTALSLSFAGQSFSLGNATLSALTFDPATVVATWQIALSLEDSDAFIKIDATLTGNASAWQASGQRQSFEPDAICSVVGQQRVCRPGTVTRDVGGDGQWSSSRSTTVPEPTSLSLIALGLAGVGAARRRTA